MPFKIATKAANGTPEIPRNKWKSKMFKEIGTNTIKAKAIHFFNKSIAPIAISNVPTKGKT